MESEGRKLPVRVCLDTGSALSLIRRDAARELGLEGTKCKLQLAVAGGGESKLSHEEVVCFKLSSLDGKYISPSIQATTTKTITSSIRAVKINTNDYEHLKNVKFTEKYPQAYDSRVDILLDTNVTLFLLNGAIIAGPKPDSPKVVPTHLGPILGGAHLPPLSQLVQFINSSKLKTSAVSVVIKDKQTIHEAVPGFDAWTTLEDVGCMEKDGQWSEEDENAVTMMNKLTSYDAKTKVWTTGLLWKLDPATHLDSNFAVCRNIAVAARKKAIRDKKTDIVDAAFREQIDAGFAELVPANEIRPGHPVYCIPTHPVYKPGALTTKTRIVMNASSKCRSTGFSLNECLYQGPTLLPDLVKILLCWRIFKYVVVADISKMFWKVRITGKDTDCLRFCWQWATDDQVSLYRALSVTFGVISAPFQAVHTVNKHAEMFKEEFPKAAETVEKRLYMDDLSALENERAAAVRQAREINELFLLASMQAHKWNSNDLSILSDAGIPEKFWSKVKMQKVLGVQWNVETDNIEFNYSDIVDPPSGKPETKRSLIAQTARAFDPLGYIAPVVLSAKLMFQQTWLLDIKWDDPLPPHIAIPWEAWRKDIGILKTLTQVRLLSVPSQKHWLAVFSDASGVAYGACVYLVSGSSSRLLYAKSKVAPSKRTKLDDEKLTIARLELLAALIATRVADYVVKSIGDDLPTTVKFFTDSTITLCRIRGQNGSKYKAWVANRLFEIGKRSKPSQWHFVPGQLNPSDCTSRQCGAQELLDNTLWWEGPAFLKREASHWPTQKALSRGEAEEQNSTDDKEQSKEHALICLASKPKSECPWQTLNERCEKWTIMTRSVAYIFRFLAAKVPKLVNRPGFFVDLQNNAKGALKVNELRLAQLFIFRIAQRLHFAAELVEIDPAPKSGSVFANCYAIRESSKLFQLQAYVDTETGIIRSRSRLGLSDLLPSETTSPIILPKGSTFIEKYVLFLHTSNCHSGNAATLYMLRRQFRLMGGKREVSRILHMCRKKNCNAPVPLDQKMAPLPVQRIDSFTPWLGIAVDFFGPLKTRHFCAASQHNCSTLSCKHDCLKAVCPHQGEEKAYGCLFTCLSTRAVHIELVENQATETFLLAFTRLISRRGKPTYVWSDNSKTFKCANKELIRLYKKINWQTVQDKAAQQGIDWKFRIEEQPSQAGVIERLVKSIKTPLTTVMSGGKCKFRELETIAMECEALVNSRPLCVVNEAEGDQMTITPAMLCLGRALTPLPFDRTKLSENLQFANMYHHRNLLVTRFWNRWRKDYLLGLQVNKYTKAGKFQLEVDQVVLVREDNLKSGEWRLGRILELFKGKDDRIRRVRLKVGKSVIDRHVNRLSLIEGAGTKKQQSLTVSLL